MDFEEHFVNKLYISRSFKYWLVYIICITLQTFETGIGVEMNISIINLLQALYLRTWLCTRLDVLQIHYLGLSNFHPSVRTCTRNVDYISRLAHVIFLFKKELLVEHNYCQNTINVSISIVIGVLNLGQTAQWTTQIAQWILQIAQWITETAQWITQIEQ